MVRHDQQRMSTSKEILLFRLGLVRFGAYYHGLSIVDGIKLIKKELIIVQKYNGIMFIMSPILLFSCSLLLWSIII